MPRRPASYAARCSASWRRVTTRRLRISRYSTVAATNAANVGGREGRIDRGGSRLELWVIPTDEELLIARDAYRVVAGVESRF